jgi:Permuted papain-like amidase enzyme, YaeF/YiiX, C92 family
LEPATNGTEVVSPADGPHDASNPEHAMHVLLVAAAFTIGVPSSTMYTSPSSAAADLEQRVQTGTLLVCKGDCLAVKVFTCSRYTHVAAVARENGRTWVYESAHGHGVRRQTLEDFLDGESPNMIYVLNPKQPYSPKRARLFKKHLDGELGRRYAIKHHFTGTRSDGVHCSEYVTDALISCRLVTARRPSRVTPASLAKGVLQSGLYEAECAVELKDEGPEHPVGDNRCEQLWIDTKICTHNFCIKIRRLFACR